MYKKDPTQNSKQLGNLLLRYKQFLKPPQQSVLKEVVGVVKEVVGVEVGVKQFEYNVSSRTVYVKTASVIRNEIVRQKGAIKKALIERLGEQNSPVDFV